MPDATKSAEMTAPAEQRRLGREKRRGGGDSLRGRAMQASPPAAAILGAAVGVVAGLVAAARTTHDDHGNIVSGDVAVHLLNRIELLTIRLQLRQAAGGAPTEIDVHRVEADASSRASSSR
jgi:hypothetical protein